MFGGVFLCTIVLKLCAEIACDAQDAVCLGVCCGGRSVPETENAQQPHSTQQKHELDEEYVFCRRDLLAGLSVASFLVC